MLDIALVGIDSWGVELASEMAGESFLSLKLICEKNLELQSALKRRFPNIEAISDYKDILYRDEIAAVAIDVPLEERYELTKSFLESGRHCLVKSPLTDNLNEAEELAQLAEKKGLVLMCGQIPCYTGSARLLKSMRERGETGRLRFYDAVQMALPPLKKPGHVLWDLGADCFGLMEMLVPEQPIYVNAVSLEDSRRGSEDIAYVSFQFETDLIAHFTLNRASHAVANRVTLGYDEKTVFWDENETDREIKIFSNSSSRNLSAGELGSGVDRLRNGDIYIPRIETARPSKIMLAEFCDCISKDRKPLTDAEFNVRVVRSINAAMRSISGSGTNIPLWAPGWM